MEGAVLCIFVYHTNINGVSNVNGETSFECVPLT